MSGTELQARLDFDLNTRQQVFGSGDTIEVAAGTEKFWNWYASTIRFSRSYNLVSRTDVPEYTERSEDIAFWYSGGVESTYTREQISHLKPVFLRIEDFPLFNSHHRKIGQIHFICAAIAASLGFKTTYLGVERNDLLLAKNPYSVQYVERTEAFTKAWSLYQPKHRLITVCGHLHKEELITWLNRRSIKITGTCDRYQNGDWCGDCYKCFEAFYSAKAVGISLNIPLTRRGFDEYYSEYQHYVDSGFVDNFNNAYQHYVRLQIMYYLRFEPEIDCVI
jgi:hypothetical protein